MRDTRHRRAPGALLLALLVLAGCGSGSSQTFTAATPKGLSYALKLTTSGKQQCQTTSIRATLPDGRPVAQRSHFCGLPAEPGHPLLIQARSSPQALVIDVRTAGCGAVRGGPPHAVLKPLVSHCTTGAPQFRATVLPAVHRLLLSGIPGVPVINFRRHPCRIICVTALI